jgi:hypothetical protein
LALKVIQLEAKNVQLEEKIGKLEAKVEQQDSLFKNYFSREKNERKAAATGSVPISNNQSAVAINGLPSSCGDLKMIGHIWSGFYSVMGSAKMESVYCDFTKLPSDEGKYFRFSQIIQLQLYFINSIIELKFDEKGFQSWIGYVDVKSAPVFFYVQRNSPFDTIRTPIPFDLALVNEGNAMDLRSGKFTAPRPGIYFFSFAGQARLSSSSSYVYFSSYLHLNGNRIGTSSVAENNGPVNQWSPLTLQSTLNLKKGDQLWVEINYSDDSSSYLHDDSAHTTHFTGFMLEEEIAASL